MSDFLLMYSYTVFITGVCVCVCVCVCVDRYTVCIVCIMVFLFFMSQMCVCSISHRYSQVYVIYPDNLLYTYRHATHIGPSFVPSVDFLPLHRPSHCPQTEGPHAAVQVQQQHLQQEGQNDIPGEPLPPTALASVLVFVCTHSDV